MLKSGKAVEEIREIRNLIGRETKGMSLLEKAKKIHRHSNKMIKSLGLKYDNVKISAK